MFAALGAHPWAYPMLEVAHLFGVALLLGNLTLLELPETLRLPADLAQRPLPAQTAGIDGPALIAKTVLPSRRDRRWQIELAPLSRLNQWQMPQIQNGTALSLVGFTFKDEKGEAILRAEYLFLDGKAYGLRSSPA